MVQYYRTPGGLYYKQLGGGSGRKVRISEDEFEQKRGGAAKAKVTKARKSSSRSSKKVASKTISKKRSHKGLKSPKNKKSGRPVMNYTPTEQACVDYAQSQIGENVKGLKEGKFKHIAQAVAVSYNEMREAHPECADFYDREKARKDALKAVRRAEKQSKRSSRSSSRSRSRSHKGKSKKHTSSKKMEEEIVF